MDHAPSAYTHTYSSAFVQKCKSIGMALSSLKLREGEKTSG
jgi:hypothetical protein